MYREGAWQAAIDHHLRRRRNVRHVTGQGRDSGPANDRYTDDVRPFGGALARWR